MIKGQLMRRLVRCLIIAGLIILLLPTTLACSSASMDTPQAVDIPTIAPSEGGDNMIHQKVQLTNKQADGYVIPLKQVKIVCVITDVGMIGCGAFDVIALDSFAIPAAKMKSATGGAIATIDDLMDAVVKEANDEAARLGINVGMTGREALDLL
jgi:uncharacterized protein YunC (DUF1805 family)